MQQLHDSQHKNIDRTRQWLLFCKPGEVIGGYLTVGNGTQTDRLLV
jgi:hypothetical protein